MIVILSSEVALSPSFAMESFSFTFPSSIRVSAFLRDIVGWLFAIIFWSLSQPLVRLGWLAFGMPVVELMLGG